MSEGISSAGALPSPRVSPGHFPPQIKYVISNEACERFSYYGMVSILTLYLKNKLGMEKDPARELVHLFMMAVYFLPLAGGWLADRWLGRYRTILYISLFYCLGHATLAVFEGNKVGLFIGLTLIAIGSGGIKPSVSAFVGDQFGPNQDRLMTRVYGMFYWAINFGALFGFAIIPVVRAQGGYAWAFGVPGIAMGLATFVFWLGRKHYVRQPPQRAVDEGSENRVRKGIERQIVLRILVIFAAVPVFWALFQQSNTTWVFQGEKMRPFEFLGYKVDGERMQSAGPLLVMVWVPILTLGIYPLLERLGLRPTPLRRMSFGMVLGAISFLICGAIQWRMDRGATLSIAWQLLPYLVLEAGEVMVSATGLEFAFSQAPASLKSVIMSFWLLTISLGNLLVAVFTSINAHWVKASGASEFYFYGVLMFVTAGVFTLVASRYRRPTLT